jgi:hypothetical protein
MSAALHLAHRPLTEGDAYELGELEAIAEQSARWEPSEIWQLRAEVRVLRMELVRAERAVRQKEVLLQNAMVRELALRMELVRGV